MRLPKLCLFFISWTLRLRSGGQRVLVDNIRRPLGDLLEARGGRAPGVRILKGRAWGILGPSRVRPLAQERARVTARQEVLKEHQLEMQMEVLRVVLPLPFLAQAWMLRIPLSEQPARAEQVSWSRLRLRGVAGCCSPTSSARFPGFPFPVWAVLVTVTSCQRLEPKARNATRISGCCKPASKLSRQGACRAPA